MEVSMESKLINITFMITAFFMISMGVGAMYCTNTMTVLEQYRIMNPDAPAAHAGRICTPNMIIRKDILFVYAGPYVCSKAYEVQSFVEDASHTTMRLYIDPTGY